MKAPSRLNAFSIVATALSVFLFAVANARAGSGYKDIAQFAEGTVATLGISVEYKPDGGRSINVRFNRHPLGGTLFFHAEQWKVFSTNLGQVKNAPDGAEQKFADIDTPGGGLLRMSSVRHGQEIRLTLTRQPGQGDSYPPVVFHLQAADAAKAVDKK